MRAGFNCDQTPSHADIDWLVGPDAAALLSQWEGDPGTLVGWTLKLRQQIGATRAKLVLDQIQLRTRARAKFSRADQMFFTARLLEQSTDEAIARYKATQIGSKGTAADLCCGIGGDLIALAQRGDAVGVDRDPMAIALASANCRAHGITTVRFRVEDVTSFPVSDVDAWHIDPDRRVRGTRTTHLEWGSPGREVLERFCERNPRGAIKMAPASEVPAAWLGECEREWIGSRRECRQQVLWLSGLARVPTAHTATVVDAGPDPVSYRGDPNHRVDPAGAVDGYVFEPHAAVLAARLAESLAAEKGLRPLLSGCAYLTGHEAVVTPLLATFEVLDAMPFDGKRIKSMLRSRRIGRLEIKVRGVSADPERLRRQLRVPGDERGTLLLAGNREARIAVLATRLTGHRPA